MIAAEIGLSVELIQKMIDMNADVNSKCQTDSVLTNAMKNKNIEVKIKK